MMPRWRAEPAAVRVDERTGRGAARLAEIARHEAGVVAVRDEAQVLALGLVPHREPESRSPCARTSSFVQRAEREARRAASTAYGISASAYDWSLARSAARGAAPCAPSSSGLDARVVAGRERVGADQLHARDQVAELEVLVAERARIGRAAARRRRRGTAAARARGTPPRPRRRSAGSPCGAPRARASSIASSVQQARGDSGDVP